MIEIRVLGGLEVIRDGEPVPLPPSRKTRALLAYLVLTGRPHRREQLCEMFWDVPDDPRGALRWSLSKIRPLVDEPGRREGGRGNDCSADCCKRHSVPCANRSCLSHVDRPSTRWT